MAKHVEPMLTEPKRQLDTPINSQDFNTTVQSILEIKKRIAEDTDLKNSNEASLIELYFGTKAKGSITISNSPYKVKVEFNNGVSADLAELQATLPKATFDLVFPPKREYSASAHTAILKVLEEKALTGEPGKVALLAYKEAIEKHVHFNPQKASVKIETV